ncbi:hypothetical protein TeGR_g250 [Tetraparma gracilis]|uniref:Uncharacterized protein n=1 Tax=Tetraparma gracilis TaxID=2962635 RepID=A0ABQ6MPG1_9STRA|nr:hypothetical protein TeGR_g250 [Tetraparma gracilis]
MFSRNFLGAAALASAAALAFLPRPLREAAAADALRLCSSLLGGPGPSPAEPATPPAAGAAPARQRLVFLPLLSTGYFRELAGGLGGGTHLPPLAGAAAIGKAVAASSAPCVLIAHSCSCAPLLEFLQDPESPTSAVAGVVLISPVPASYVPAFVGKLLGPPLASAVSRLLPNLYAHLDLEEAFDVDPKTVSVWKQATRLFGGS